MAFILFDRLDENRILSQLINHVLLMSTDIFTVKRRLRDYRREMGQRSTVTIEPGLRSRSGRVVITAIVM